MKTTIRLDNRACLYGEPRLSDAQVLALRGASDDDLRRTPQGWFIQNGSRGVGAATISFLERRLMITVPLSPHFRGQATITGVGRKLLAAIDAEAPGKEPAHG